MYPLYHMLPAPLTGAFYLLNKQKHHRKSFCLVFLIQAHHPTFWTSLLLQNVIQTPLSFFTPSPSPCVSCLILHTLKSFQPCQWFFHHTLCIRRCHDASQVISMEEQRERTSHLQPCLLGSRSFPTQQGFLRNFWGLIPFVENTICWFSHMSMDSQDFIYSWFHYSQYLYYINPPQTLY